MFLNYYQILRNLVHISNTDYVVLLFPSANTAVAEESVYARDHFLTDAGRERLKIVFLDEIVSFLEGECVDGSLAGYYQEFRSKYLPRSGNGGNKNSMEQTKLESGEIKSMLAIN